MITEASISDLSEVAAIGPLFWGEGKLPGRFIPWKFIGAWKNLITNGAGVVFCMWKEKQLVGILGAIATPDINDGALVAQECFWYVKEEHRSHGLKLFFAFEKWAKIKKCARVIMVHLCNLQPDRLNKLYERMGYHPTEVHFCKTI